MVCPGHGTHIVERGKMRPGGDVRERELLARQPVPLRQQYVDIAEMLFKIEHAGAHEFRIGWAVSG